MMLFQQSHQVKLLSNFSNGELIQIRFFDGDNMLSLYVRKYLRGKTYDFNGVRKLLEAGSNPTLAINLAHQSNRFDLTSMLRNPQTINQSNRLPVPSPIGLRFRPRFVPGLQFDQFHNVIQNS